MNSKMTDLNPNTVEYAGFWIRLGAALIDTILLLIITFPALIAIYGLQYFTDESRGFISGPADFLITWIFPMAATIWFWMKYRATPGKMALSLKVVNANTGATLTLKESIIRNLAYYASLIPLGLGFIWVGFDSKKQGWHDKLAGSVVIRDKKSGKEAVKFSQTRK
jgi:uncharacterized RDD family membrane protein YckC